LSRPQATTPKPPGPSAAGIEWAFTGNWSLKAEYMFIALNDRDGFQTCGPVTTPAGGIVAGGPFCFNHSFGDIHTAKVGLNYRFTNF
jgi:outer membrane immunogenic protein